VALFASGLQQSDAPTAAMAAEAITATIRRFGIHGCLSRMAQEFGDHPDAAAARMRWICQLTAQMPAWPQRPAGTGRPGSRAGTEIQASSDRYRAPTGVPLRLLRRVVTLESAVPLIVAAAIAAGTGLLAADLFLRAQFGVSLRSPGTTYYLSVLSGLVISLGLIAATLPLLNRITGPETARNE